MSEDLKWLTEIDYLSTLKGDAREIADCCGPEILMSLIDNGFTKVTLTIPGNVLDCAKRVYVQRHFNGHNAKILAKKLSVSERVIYKWGRREMT